MGRSPVESEFYSCYGAKSKRVFTSISLPHFLGRVHVNWACQNEEKRAAFWPICGSTSDVGNVVNGSGF